MILTKTTPGSAMTASISGAVYKRDNMLEYLFAEELKDIHKAERHLLQALPVLARSAGDEELQALLTAHVSTTEKQAARLTYIFELLNIEASVKKCMGMAGITDQGNHLLNTTEPGTPSRNAAVVFIMQRIIHYQLAAYSSLAQLATALGHTTIAEILYTTLEEETLMDDLLMETADKFLYSNTTIKRD